MRYHTGLNVHLLQIPTIAKLIALQKRKTFPIVFRYIFTMLIITVVHLKDVYILYSVGGEMCGQTTYPAPRINAHIQTAKRLSIAHI
jgi:hypothetical protein